MDGLYQFLRAPSEVDSRDLSQPDADSEHSRWKAVTQSHGT